MAALTLPKFKLRWMVGAERREAARALLVAECRALPHDAKLAENKNREVAAHSSASEKDFFSFDEEEEDTMSADSELGVLNRFP